MSQLMTIGFLVWWPVLQVGANPTMFGLTLGETLESHFTVIYPEIVRSGTNRYTHGPEYQLPVESMACCADMPVSELREAKIVFSEQEKLVAILTLFEGSQSFTPLESWLDRHYTRVPRMYPSLRDQHIRYHSGESQILLELDRDNGGACFVLHAR
ncbi:hypothetical protein [Vibrio ouci]|uniref:Uncharacterized protein n=1 Tax=Vibrio ouci TaxID=2499078 RepID=A0A4Y8WDF3_9VIBR|nr:hypothetical protein [Vibrio ouci]TFH90301.1 hypothetical protein ELS82_17845 [Vibrio ouci]